MTLSVPTKGDGIELSGYQYVLNQTFGDQLFDAVDGFLKRNNDPEWFERIRAIHEGKKLDLYDDPKDPRFLLKEGAYPNTSIAAAFPGLLEYKGMWRLKAKELKDIMNLWSHNKVRPDYDQFLDYVLPLSEMSILCSLPISHDIQKIIQRVRDLKAGKIFTEKQEELPKEAQDYARKIAEKIEEEKSRPPVGALWVGNKPSREVQLHRSTLDITETGESIRDEFGSDEVAREKIRVLMKYFPMGGKLYIATDGAIMGYVKGDKTLVGWVGKEPNVDATKPRGFFVNHSYEFTGDDVIDVETNTALSDVAEDCVSNLINGLNKWGLKPESRFNVSVYGDVVYIDDDTDKEYKITYVHKGIWFPGHLPG